MNIIMTSIARTMAEQHPVRKLYLAWLLLGLLSLSGISQAATTSTNQIIDTAQAFLEQEVQNYLTNSKIDGRHEVSIGRLDPRLRLAACSQPLTPQLESSQQPIGRVTVRIRCEGQAPWSIFVPAQVNLFRNVVVTRRPIQRSSIIQSADIMLAERDVSSLSQGYFLAISEALGSEATRALQANQVLSPNNLRAPLAIKRGEQVTIISSGGTVHVRISGEALSDGAIGQQIRVRNSQSQRIIHARVIGPGEVEAGK